MHLEEVKKKWYPKMVSWEQREMKKNIEDLEAAMETIDPVTNPYTLAVVMTEHAKLERRLKEAVD
jgi:hypothetical protein